MQINWLWLVVGLIPYAIQRQQKKNEHFVRIRALFWQLTLRWKSGHCSWELTLPFIEHWPPGPA